MWISKRLRSAMQEPKAERGSVTLSDQNEIEAGGTISTRNMDAYLPYGYNSTPPVGEEVMLLPSTDGQVLIGTKNYTKCESGEIVILSQGGARIELKNDGTIVLNSLVIDRNGVIQN